MTIFGKPLQDLLLAPCFRTAPGNEQAKANFSDCLTSSVRYYTTILSAVAAFVTFCYIIKAGYTMFTAFGDEAKYAEGKKTLQYAIIGFVISISAYFFIHFFVGLLGYNG